MQVTLKRLLFISIAVMAMIFVSACGSDTGSQAGNTTTPTAAATTAPAPTDTPTPAPAPAAVVKVAQATVAGKSENVLVNDKGMTLYYYKPDTASTVACTGGCATNWPPVVFSGSGAPTGGDGVTGKLAVLTGANGAQVTYNGHPLYTFIADKAPGDTVGQGKGGVWFVATPDLATLS
jgi:predicted lipoprotein with Yx(FWY)xxD motif